MDFPQPGTIALDSWAGRTTLRLTIVGETPKKYKVIFEQDTRLPGRWVRAGEVTMVPKDVVKIGGER